MDKELLDAAYQGNLNEVRKCLSLGADVLARNSHHTVLHAAVHNEEVLKLVLNQIKETQRDVSHYINAKDTEGDTPLMWAAYYGYVRATQLLLDYGADTEVKNNDGMTALHWAAKGRNGKVTELLISKGANVNAEDKDGKKPCDTRSSLLDPHIGAIRIANRTTRMVARPAAMIAGTIALGAVWLLGQVVRTVREPDRILPGILVKKTKKNGWGWDI